MGIDIHAPAIPDYFGAGFAKDRVNRATGVKGNPMRIVKVRASVSWVIAGMNQPCAVEKLRLMQARRIECGNDRLPNELRATEQRK
jgi:hypothetical protein